MYGDSRDCFFEGDYLINVASLTTQKNQEFLLRLFQKLVNENNGYDGTRRVIDISGDGYNNIGRNVREARDAAVSAGFIINGLPIINDRPNATGRPPPPDLDNYYEDNVIGGPGSFIVVAESFDNFSQAILSKLIREIAYIGSVP